MKVLVPFDFRKYPTKDLVIENREEPPLNPKEGLVYFDLGDLNYYGWNGVEWKLLSSDFQFPLSDSLFSVKSKDDPSKQVEFDLSKVKSGSKIKLKFPSADVNLKKDVFHGYFDPRPSDDISEGYEVGSSWINETQKREFISVCDIEDNAEWIERTKTKFYQLNDVPSNYLDGNNKLLTPNESEDRLVFKGLDEILKVSNLPFVNLKGFSITLNNIRSQQVVHNLNTKNLVYKLYDESGDEFFPGNFNIQDENSVVVEMTPQIKGILTIIGIGN